MRFEGIYTPVVTPHRQDHSIDEDGFAEVIEHLIKVRSSRPDSCRYNRRVLRPIDGRAVSYDEARQRNRER